MLKYASLTLPRGYNIEKGRGGQKVKIWEWKTHAFNETGLFRGVSQLLLSMIVDTRQPGSVFKKLDTRQSEILTNFLEIARLISLRT